MKAHFTNCIKHWKLIISVIAFSIIIISLGGCAKELEPKLIICNLEDHSSYPKFLEESLPSYEIEQWENMPYYILDNGGIVEAFDTQAIGALETGIARYWYPQYLATVIIAVDRNKTKVKVSNWSDLFDSQEEIGISNKPGDIEMLTSAISYGLEGQDYSLKKATQLLTSLHDNNRLKTNSFESPINICYDYQAANLIENGRNIEIIIPTEGTFTYEKGLLSNKELDFQGNMDKLLLEANLRLLDGQSKNSIYPDVLKYSPAVRVADYKYFAKNTQNIKSVIERKVLNSKRYMSIDNREHLHFALIYIIIIVIWILSILRQSMQKGISYAAFFTGVILIGWTFVRLIKYQTELNKLLTRYLWYGFYIFQLTLPLVLLWMAWAIDKAEDKIFLPKWWQNIAKLITILIVLVFTNDLHGLVFKLDLNRPDWDIHYSYGIGYYVILSVSMLNLIGVFLILVEKGIKNPRKKIIILPLLVLYIFAVYNYKYIIRDPFAYATDITIITGLFTLLMFQSCIISGLIPVNTKYIQLFKGSPLKMQIVNNNRQIVLSSASPELLNKATLDKVVDSSPIPILQDDFLLFSKAIPGGHTVWSEDISKLCQLHEEIQKSSQMLKEANSILIEEKRLKADINEKNAKKQLMGQLETEIAERIKQLSNMIEQLPFTKDHPRESTRIALLLSYIKRRCNLFFQEKETNTLAIDELIICQDELTEISKYSNVQIASIKEVSGKIDIRQATLFYEFFYSLVDFAVAASFSYIILDFETKDGFISMGFLASEDLRQLKLDPSLIKAIHLGEGKLVKKVIEDTFAISISFPQGDDRYD